MFKLVSNLFGRPSRPALVSGKAAARERDARAARLDEIAPAKHESTAVPDTGAAASFVCREAVLNRGERICGYEFALEGKLRSRFMDERARPRNLADDLLVRTLNSLGVGQLLGSRLSFVEVSIAMASSASLRTLPTRNSVILFDQIEAHGSELPMARTQVAELRELGYKVGARLHPGSFPMAESSGPYDFFRVQTGDFDGLQLAELVATVKERSLDQNAATLMIASGIATFDDFQLCFRGGFDLFQGAFIASRENWHPPKSEINRAKVIQILNRLRAGAQTDELAGALRQDAILTYKMLRYVNAPAMGLRTHITEVEQALVLLGRDKFYRWLSLLLFEVKGAGYAERTLFEQALVRARMMEQIAQNTSMPQALAEQLFMTGLFSLLPPMLGQPIEEIIAKVAVAAPVREALLTGGGPFGTFLQLAIACEKGESERVAELADNCALDLVFVNREQIGALAWANEVTEGAVSD